MAVDYSPEAVAKRLRLVSELRNLGLSLSAAGRAIRDRAPILPTRFQPREGQVYRLERLSASPSESEEVSVFWFTQCELAWEHLAGAAGRAHSFQILKIVDETESTLEALDAQLGLFRLSPV